MTAPLVDASTLGRVQRALSGRCEECRGDGRRKNATGTLVYCATCDGAGKLEWLTLSQVACFANAMLCDGAQPASVNKTLDALTVLTERGIAERSSNQDGPLKWRLKRSSAQR